MKKADDGIKAFKTKLASDNLSGIYIFTGEEKYARKSAVDVLRKKFEDFGFPEFNIEVFEEKAATVEAIRAYAESFPVMSEYKLAIIKNSGIFKTATDEMKNFWQNLTEQFPEYLAVVFDEDNIDGRSALIKKMKPAGIYAEFNYKTPAELAAWCGKLFSTEGISVSEGVLEQLVFSCDDGMENLKNETEKLISYCGDKKTVTAEDVSLIVRKSLKSRMFDMLDAISEKRAMQAYEMLGELKVCKESPVKITAMMGRHLSQLLKTALLLDENRYGEIATELGIRPYFVKKYVEQAKASGTDRLAVMSAKCLETDFAIKSGKTDDWTAVELLISELMEK